MTLSSLSIVDAAGEWLSSVSEPGRRSSKNDERGADGRSWRETGDDRRMRHSAYVEFYEEHWVVVLFMGGIRHF